MGIVKAVYQITFGKGQDKTFQSSVTFWGFLQLQIGMIAACAATLKPLVSRVLGLGASIDRYITPGPTAGRGVGSRYGYGQSRVSRGTRLEDTTITAPGKFTGDEDDEEIGGASSSADSTDGYEMRTGLRHGVGIGIGVTTTTTTAAGGAKSPGASASHTSFYKHGGSGSGSESGSEEMILGVPRAHAQEVGQGPGPARYQPGHKGIVMTTEVKVSRRLE